MSVYAGSGKRNTKHKVEQGRIDDAQPWNRFMNGLTKIRSTTFLQLRVESASLIWQQQRARTGDIFFEFFLVISWRFRAVEEKDKEKTKKKNDGCPRGASPHPPCFFA